MSGQIVDPTLVSASRRGNTEDEKRAIKEGRIPEGLDSATSQVAAERPRLTPDGEVQQAEGERRRLDADYDIAIPIFGYQSHVSIDRGFGFIRKWAASATAYEGADLREGLLDTTNTAPSLWADTAYRSATNETFMAKNGFGSCVHRKEAQGQALCWIRRFCETEGDHLHRRNQQGCNGTRRCQRSR